MSSLPPEQTIILQLKMHSKDSERILKKWMLMIQGVRRVDFDAHRGLVLVSGTIDPPTLVLMIEEFGYKVKIFEANGPPVRISSPKNSAGLKTVEVTNKTVRLYFGDGENGGRAGNNSGVDHGGRHATENNMHSCGGCPLRNGNFSCVNCGGGYFPTSWPQPAGDLGFSPQVPSAPPLPEGYNSPASAPPPPSPPPETDPFYTVFSDSNFSSRCTIL
nr:uncharacterized protein LOC109186295 [Ipomoea trifida]